MVKITFVWDGRKLCMIEGGKFCERGWKSVSFGLDWTLE